MKTARPLALLAATLAAATIAFAAPPPVVLRPFVTVGSPVEIAHANDGSNRVFVVQQSGRIRVVRNGSLLATPFLDIASLLQTGGEQGLLGLAFHPQYATNGRFYVFYTRAAVPSNNGNELVVARYQRSAANPDVADAQSGSVVIVIPHPGQTNHNGGKLAFGRDGLLYIAVGDGGGGGDPFDAAANLNDLRGKILRLDVDSASPYAVPASNPYVNQAGRRGEILLYGLRNPWRFGFDRASGDLFIADVGQNAWEEVNHVTAAQVAVGGLDFGWHRWEGNHCYPPGSTSCAATGNMVFPILEYDHNAGESITGGFRYRGRRFPELTGFYVYGDFTSGRVWAAEPSGGGWTTTEVATVGNLSTFGEDEDGEIYAGNIGTGAIVRLAPVDSDNDGMSDAFEAMHLGGATAGDAVADSDNDGVPNVVEYFERLTPSVKDNDVFNDARLFAMQQYRDFLAREGERLGIASWSAQIGAGLPRREVIASFLFSPEFQGAIAPVARLYFAYFQRVPDYGGLTFWIGYLKAGNSLQAVSDNFAASSEFQQEYGALTNAEFVDLVYRNVLGRQPDASGRAYWLGQLDSGAATRGQVMLGFSESNEHRGRMGGEVFVTMAYVGMLRRSPDPQGYAYWLNWMESGQSGYTLLDGFLASPEYRQRFMP